MNLSTPAVHTYHVDGRRFGTGRILAILTDGPADLSVAAHTANLSAATGAPVVAAAVIGGTGFSINPLLHRVRAHRIAEETNAIIGRVTPTLATPGGYLRRTTLSLPARYHPHRPLPAWPVYRLAASVDATIVIIATPLRDIHPRLTLMHSPSNQHTTAPAR